MSDKSYKMKSLVLISPLKILILPRTNIWEKKLLRRKYVYKKIIL